MTPHLLAEASRSSTTPAACSRWRASGVMKELAPSTITPALGFPSGPRNCFQFRPSMVSGRPPAGMKRSAGTRKSRESNSWWNSSRVTQSSRSPAAVISTRRWSWRRPSVRRSLR